MLHDDALDRLRAICLVFPEAQEAGGVGNPSFKVRERAARELEKLGDGVEPALRTGLAGRPSVGC